MINWKKIAGIFIAMNGVGCGVAIFLQSGLGSDPIGILCDGIHCTCHIQFGHASLFYNLGMILLALVCAKKNMGVGSITYALVSGYFIDFYCWILKPIQLNNLNWICRMSSYLLGLGLFTMAISILIQFKLGMNALDAVLNQLAVVLKIPYAILRTLSDALYVIIGYLLGGTFGIGTVICVITTGVLVKMFSKGFLFLTNKMNENYNT